MTVVNNNIHVKDGRIVTDELQRSPLSQVKQTL